MAVCRIRMKNKNIEKLFEYIFIILFALNFNLRVVNKISTDGRFIPDHSTIELIYKDIKYEDTAQFKHVINRYGRSNINLIKKIKK